MKARPILFSKDMATAIINGAKNQTRRVIKDSFNGCWTGGVQGHPCPNEPVVMHPGELIIDYEGKYHKYEAEVVEAWFYCSTMDKLAKCPYGKVGDILYGRETIWTHIYDGSIIYEKPEPKYAKFCKATPSIHVPRKHARIWLQIIDIRVERLLDVSEEDAIAEGIEGVESLSKDAYLILWDRINGKDSHKINPWVWVIEFENIGFEKAVMLLTHGEKS